MDGAAVGLGKILGTCWLLTYLALALGFPKFQNMEHPSLASQTSTTIADPLLVGGGGSGMGVTNRGHGVIGFVRRRLARIRISRRRRRCETCLDSTTSSGASGSSPSGRRAGRGNCDGNKASVVGGGAMVVGGRKVVPVLRAGGSCGGVTGIRGNGP